ncbi:MAG: GTP cyclohydrolase I FolE [candidate division Zixibacteria bacterium]|nr:GTP cyclohydrolase I FolE [candidate division Zixibacteria bacterium]
MKSSTRKTTPKKSRKHPLRRIDKEKIISGIKLVIEGIGEDPTREGLVRTPERVAGFYEEAFSGVGVNASEEVTLYTAENRDEMIIVKDIPFYSMCEHHLLPFFGKAHIAYIPGKNKITGFSHLARVIETLARRPTTQEVLTSTAANILRKSIKPKGILIVTEAEHLCMTIRGVKKPGSMTITSAIRGCMRKDATRAEAFALIKGPK